MKQAAIFGTRRRFDETPLSFVDCPVCSAVNKFRIRHTGSVCEEGKAAFDPTPTPEYKIFLDEFFGVSDEDLAKIIAAANKEAH